MWLTLLWSMWLMSPWRAYLLLLQGHTRWIGTHGEMISSDLHRAKSPPDGCWDPSQGQRQIRGLYQRERRRFHQTQTGRPRPRGSCPSYHDVCLGMLMMSPNVLDTLEAVVCQVARVVGSRGPRRPNVSLLEANVSLRRPNVTLKGHDVIFSSWFRVLLCHLM